MSSVSFRTSEADLLATTQATVSALPDPGQNQLRVTVDPAGYERIREERLFSGSADQPRLIEPIVSDEPVDLLLKWIGSGEPPRSIEGLDASNWQLLEATQDRDGVQVGFRTQRPERISEAVLSFLAADGWESLRTSPAEPIRTRYSGTSGEFDCDIYVDEDRELLVVVAYLPVPVAESRLPQMGELANLLNFRMDLGAIEIAPQTHDVRVRHGIDVEDVPLTSALIRNVIYPVVVHAEQYLPLVRAVAAGDDPGQTFSELGKG
ncbi:YbjN domain-containing protein [Jatrophihabitans sp. DSM 45814]